MVQLLITNKVGIYLFLKGIFSQSASVHFSPLIGWVQCVVQFIRDASALLQEAIHNKWTSLSMPTCA